MASRLSLTGEERVLLYLLNFKSLDDVHDCDPGITQKGISVNTRIQRKHISRYLDKLVADGLAMEEAKRVSGAKQKMKCYGLTPQGLQRARVVKGEVEPIAVKVRMGGEIRDMRIADIDGATSVHLRLSDIVVEALETDGPLDMARLESIEDENRRMMDERTMRADVYRKALTAAWRSGILTSSEKHLVEALKAHLGITDIEHRAMEIEARNCKPEPYDIRADLEDEILNLLAGQPTEIVRETVELLKSRFQK